jgi:hypothetical protein
MAIAFRAGAGGQNTASPATVTVPAGVQPGDIVLLFPSVDTPSSTISVSTGGATTPSRLTLDSGPASVFALYQFAAASGDAGAVISFSASASTTPLVVTLVAYSGAGLVGAGGFQAFTGAASLTTTSPQFTPPSGASWGIAFGANNSGSPPTYSPGTLRGGDAFDVSIAYDSNGTASPVGGGTWTNGASDVWWGYTVALPPAGLTARPLVAPSLAAIQAASW